MGGWGEGGFHGGAGGDVTYRVFIGFGSVDDRFRYGQKGTEWVGLNHVTIGDEYLTVEGENRRDACGLLRLQYLFCPDGDGS